MPLEQRPSQNVFNCTHTHSNAWSLLCMQQSGSQFMRVAYNEHTHKHKNKHKHTHSKGLVLVVYAPKWKPIHACGV